MNQLAPKKQANIAISNDTKPLIPFDGYYFTLDLNVEV